MKVSILITEYFSSEETSGGYLVQPSAQWRQIALGVIILNIFEGGTPQPFGATSSSIWTPSRWQQPLLLWEHIASLLSTRILGAFSATVRVNSSFTKYSFLKENHQVALLDALLLLWFLSFTFDFSASFSALSLKSIFDVQISFVPKTFLQVPVENSAKWNKANFYLLWKGPSSSCRTVETYHSTCLVMGMYSLKGLDKPIRNYWNLLFSNMTFQTDVQQQDNIFS